MSLNTPDLAALAGPKADSPFYPASTLQFAWDSVSLTAAMACWRRYQYAIIEGLQPKGPARAIALDFGIAFHKALEWYENLKAEGLDHDEATRQTVLKLVGYSHYMKLPTTEEAEAEAAAAAADEDGDDGISTRNTKIRTRYHLMRAVVWYLEHYREDEAKTLIQPSGKPAVEVSFRIPIPVDVGGRQALLVGHIDRAATLNGHTYVSDYKTTKGLSRQFFSDFELSHQLTGYSLAGSVIFEQPISGIIIDGIALQVGGAQFKRQITKRSEGQISEYLDTVANTLSEAEYHAETQLYPMNTSACYFCQFKELCSKPPEYRENYKQMLYDRTSPWNPLENR